MHAFFTKKHFYKQLQAEIGKKIKQMVSNTLWDWTFAFWKLCTVFIYVIIQN